MKRILLDGKAVHVDHAVFHDSCLLKGSVQGFCSIANVRKPMGFCFFQVLYELSMSG